MGDLWPEIVVGGLAGFLAGFLGALAERTMFSARESWEQARRSGRFLRHLLRQSVGREKVLCPDCLSADVECHDLEVDPVENELTGEIVGAVLWEDWSCRECGNRWARNLEEE